MATRWSSSSTNCRRFRCFAARVGVELVGFAYGFRTFEDEPWNDWYAEVLRAVGPVQGDTEHPPDWAFDGAAVSNNWRTVFAGQDYGPFRPFRLRPGETRFLRLDFHTATCDPAGLQDGFSRIVSLPVRYRTLGVTRTATVPIDQVSVAIRTIGICDHPLETSLR